MIRYESGDFVKELLENESCILLPIEISQTSEGELWLLAYPFCKNIAEAFEQRFSSDPFGEEAISFLKEQLTPMMETLGYSTVGADTHFHIEYRCDKPNEGAILPACEIIGSLDRERWTELELDDFFLDPTDPTDRMAVVREQKRIVCYAGINDLSEEDGFLELTVECEENCRGRGYGASCVALLTKYLTAQGCRAKYVCAKDHIASRKTAERAGFTPYRMILSFVCIRIGDTEE